MVHMVDHMVNPPATSKALADNILRIVKDDGRNIEWLARKARIPSRTLRAQLTVRTNCLTAHTVHVIASALGRSVAELVA